MAVLMGLVNACRLLVVLGAPVFAALRRESIWQTPNAQPRYTRTRFILEEGRLLWRSFDVRGE